MKDHREGPYAHVAHSVQVPKEWCSVSASTNHSRMKEFCQQLLQLRVYRRRVGKKRTIRRPHEGQTAMTRERGPFNMWD
jgi:hypothetical protein